MAALGANRTSPPHQLILMLSLSQGPLGWSFCGSRAHLSPGQVWAPDSPRQGEIQNYKHTQKGEVGFLWKPLQLMFVPDTAQGQARVITMPVVVIIVCADQTAV